MILTNADGKHVRFISADSYRKLLEKGKAPPLITSQGRIPDDIRLAQRAIWATDPAQRAQAELAAEAEKKRTGATAGPRPQRRSP